jgi:hypothetical protein
LDLILEGLHVTTVALREGKDLLESILLVTMSTHEDMRQMASSFQQQLAESLNQQGASLPATTESESLEDVIEADMESMLREVFEDFRAFDEDAKEKRKKTEQLAEMRAQQRRNKNMLRAEKIMAWVEADTSQLLWVDGNKVLGRYDFNSLFVSPLLIFGDSSYESVLILRHFCGDTHGPSDANNFRTVIQALIIQIFRQRPNIFDKKKKSLDKGNARDIVSLWGLFLDCMEETVADCVFVIIDGIDHLQDSDTGGGQTERAFILSKLHTLVQHSKILMKVLLSAELSEEPAEMTENQMAVIAPYLPMDFMREESPMMPHTLIEIQERRCQSVTYAEMPLLYPRESIVYGTVDGELRAFIVESLSGMEPRPGDDYTFESLRVKAWCVGHNGRFLTRQHHYFQIAPFQGKRPISSLKLIPSGYLKDEAEERRRLIAQGRRYFDLSVGFHHKEISRNGVR